MTRERTSAAAGPGSAGTMKHRRYVALHALMAAAFIFLLQRYVMRAVPALSLLWALALGGGAAGLAYKQSNR